MKLASILFLFFSSSLFLIFITIEQNAEKIETKYNERLEVIRLQKICSKSYLRTKKKYVPKRSYLLAKREIQNVLLNSPITFKANDSSLLMNTTLIQIVEILNHLKESVVLSISAHTDAEGSKKHNLLLSQQRADRLKKFFEQRVNLPYIVAIGYGESFSLEHRLIEINLKRIKQ